jgi:uncharacterized membrane protein YgcG
MNGVVINRVTKKGGMLIAIGFTLAAVGASGDVLQSAPIAAPGSQAIAAAASMNARGMLLEDLDAAAIQDSAPLFPTSALAVRALPGAQCWTQVQNAAFFEEDEASLDTFEPAVAFLFTQSSKELPRPVSGSDDASGTHTTGDEAAAWDAARNSAPPLTDDINQGRAWIADALTVADTSGSATGAAGGSSAAGGLSRGIFSGSGGGGSGGSAGHAAVFALSQNPAPVPLPAPLWAITGLLAMVFGRQVFAGPRPARLAPIS